MILTNVAARPGGDLLCVTSSDGWVVVWRPIDNRIVASHELGRTVNKAAWTADGEHLVVTQGDSLIVLSQDGTDRVREIETPSLRTFSVHPTEPILASVGD